MILDDGNDDELRESFLDGGNSTIVQWLTVLLHGDSYLKLADPKHLFRWDVDGENEIKLDLTSSADGFRTWLHFGSLVIWYGVPVDTHVEAMCVDGGKSWFWSVQPPKRYREHDALWVQMDRLLPDAPVCEQCKIRSILVKPAPIMTAYAQGPQPQPPLCPDCTEDWVYQWDERWAEYNASRG